MAGSYGGQTGDDIPVECQPGHRLQIVPSSADVMKCDENGEWLFTVSCIGKDICIHGRRLNSV